MVLKMISWKDPFERLSEEYEMTRKKRQALENLLDDGRISQSTYNSFNKKIDEAIADIERQQKELLDKVNSKAGELDQHIKTLETLLANFEIRHVTGEIEEDVYQREVELLSTGLETARQELDTVKEAVNQISNSMPIQTTGIVAPAETETQTTEENVEIPQPETEEIEETPQVVEIEETSEEHTEQTLPEPPGESAEGSQEEEFQNQQESWETPQETWQDTEETEETTQSTEEETQSMETEVQEE